MLSNITYNLCWNTIFQQKFSFSWPWLRHRYQCLQPEGQKQLLGMHLSQEWTNYLQNGTNTPQQRAKIALVSQLRPLDIWPVHFHILYKHHNFILCSRFFIYSCRAQNKGWSPLTDRPRLVSERPTFIMGGHFDRSLFSVHIKQFLIRDLLKFV